MLTTREALRTKREQKGLSARQLSADLGKSPTYVSKIESGDIHLSFEGFCEIVRHLELSSLEILYLVVTEGH